MPKMRVLIAATGDRPAAIAALLGVHTPTPDIELGAARSRHDLFHHLARGRWNAVILEPRFDGASADEILIAGSELLEGTRVLILGHAGEPGAAAHQHLLVAEADLAPRLRTPTPGAAPTTPALKDALTGLPCFDSMRELLDHDGRRPRTGLLSCILIDTSPDTAADIARVCQATLSDGGIAGRWGSSAIIILRRATSPGEALVFAEGLRLRLAPAAPPAIGVTWFDAADVGETGANQADHALHLARSRAGGVASWREVLSFRIAEAAAIATSGRSPVDKRADFLSRAAHSLGPVQREHITTHSEEVSSVAADLAQLLQLSAREIEHVRTAALLHDLGKAAIPDVLLAKPGPLTPTERLVMDRHSSIGAELCEALGIDPEVARTVRHHHTRFDASHAAPAAARIIAVADAMVTMTSARPYSAARSYADALAELRRCRGTIFDPKAVVAAHILGASSMAA